MHLARFWRQERLWLVLALVVRAVALAVRVAASAITVALGLMRANVTISVVSITIGKFLRYVLIVYGASLFL